MTSLTIHMGSAALTGYFIAPTGSDTTGDGTIGNPWRTAKHWFDTVAAAGGTLYLRGGTYVGSDIDYWWSSTVGTAEAPVLIAAYPGETPVLDGSSSAANCWAFDDGGAYITLRGVRHVNWTVTSSGIVWVGRETVGVPHHITIEDCYFGMTTGQGQNDHAIYISRDCNNVIVQRCEFNGNTSNGYGVNVYNHPESDGVTANITVRDSNFYGWGWPDTGAGVNIDSERTDGGTDFLVHGNTFSGNNINIRAQRGTNITVSGNSGAHGAQYDILRGLVADTPNYSDTGNVWT